MRYAGHLQIGRPSNQPWNAIKQTAVSSTKQPIRGCQLNVFRKITENRTRLPRAQNDTALLDGVRTLPGSSIKLGTDLWKHPDGRPVTKQPRKIPRFREEFGGIFILGSDPRLAAAYEAIRDDMPYNGWAVSIIPKLKIEVEEKSLLRRWDASVGNGLYENIWPSKSGFGYLPGLFQDISLSRVDSPLQEGNKHSGGRRYGYDDVGYLEPGPEASRNIHALVLPLVLLLVFGGGICAILADKFSNKWLRCLALVCAAVAMCGAPIFAIIGWGIANVIDCSM